MTLVKTWKQHRAEMHTPLTTMIVRDGAIYYVTILGNFILLVSLVADFDDDFDSCLTLERLWRIYRSRTSPLSAINEHRTQTFLL